MTDRELIQDIMQKADEQSECIKEEIAALQNAQDRAEAQMDRLEAKLDGIRVYLETDLQRTLSLLLEGQQALLDRITPPERYEALEIRTGALEIAVKQHSEEIRDLKLA